MRKIWNKSSKRRSFSGLSRSNDDDSLEDYDPSGSALSSHLRSLIVPEYDSSSSKIAWVNALLNVSASADFTPASLRLYRVDLRGSHLYFYRAPTLMNIRLFKNDSLGLDSEESSQPEDSDINETSESNFPTPQTAIDPRNSLSDPKNSFLLESKNSMASSPSLSTPLDSEIGTSLTYFLPILPHPDLDFDFVNNSFLPSSTIEALVHFFLFADSLILSSPISTVTQVLPLLPNFPSILELIHTFIVAVYNGSFGESVSTTLVSHRVLFLFGHLRASFCGYLLKSDTAPHILSILELISQNSLASIAPKVQAFKSSMLESQKVLLQLIDSSDLTGPTSLTVSGMSSTSTPSPSKVFSDLNYAAFLELDLLALANAITKIDKQFFQSWNASIDKSLLFSSIVSVKIDDVFYKKNPLIFNNSYHIHYLARLFIHHMFGNPSLSAEKRARILERWIDLGCILDKSGNMSSWLGLSSIILSQPILRLREVWTYVSSDHIELLKKDWALVLYELERKNFTTRTENANHAASDSDIDLSLALRDSYHIMAPRGLGKFYPKENVVPYFGDFFFNNTRSTNVLELLMVWDKIRYSFERWSEYFSKIVNSKEVIAYNQDVLRRYASMGFIFSNENLNQVLYLGNGDNDEELPESLKNPLDIEVSVQKSKIDLDQSLRMLIDVNCESINLETILKNSFDVEPRLPEKYLRSDAPDLEWKDRESKDPGLVDLKLDSRDLGFSGTRLNRWNSGLSVHSTSSFSLAELAEPEPQQSVTIPLEDRLPNFNNSHFKINFAKYDSATDTAENHSVVVDQELVLRIDDFIGELDTSITTTNSRDTEYETGGSGLGIDVENILGSDKFDNLESSRRHSNFSSERKRGSGLNSIISAGTYLRTPKYIPRFVTLDRLVDLLLIDSKFFDSRRYIDIAEFRLVFMLNYGAFMTTKELLQTLTQRFACSGNAVISVMRKQYLLQKKSFNESTFGPFPNWNHDKSVNLVELGDVDYELLLKIQNNILVVLSILVTKFPGNFCNDLENKQLAVSLLKLYSNEILQWYNSNKIDKHLEGPFEELVHSYKRIKRQVVKKIYKVEEPLAFEVFLARGFIFSTSLREVPLNRNLPSSGNIPKIEKFLSKLNKYFAVLYRGITVENWFEVFIILENLFENHSLLNYNLQRVGTSDEFIEISNVINFMVSLYDSAAKDKIFQKLPLVFQKLIQLHQKFKSYLLIQLCDNLTEEERIDRMKTMLIMVRIARLKMNGTQFIFDGEGVIPSCIETTILDAITSPIGRQFADTWAQASKQLGRDVDAPSHSVSLIPDLEIGEFPVGEPLLPCFGWIFENLIEANRCPSYHQNLINFNKRYMLYKIIDILIVEESFEGKEPTTDTKEFEFLLNLDETKIYCKDSSWAESTFFDSELKSQNLLLVSENKKKALRDARQKESAQVLSSKTSSSALRRQSMSYRTNSSSRFKISGLFNKTRTFGLSNANERVVQLRDLPDPVLSVDSKQKPSLVIALKDKKIFPVYLLPSSFKIELEGGYESCFIQGLSDVDSRDWLEKLGYANRHWYMSRLLNLKFCDAYTTFGLPLEAVCARDKSSVPLVLKSILSAIESEGLTDVGIYRIGTSISELNSIKQEIDKTGYLNLSERPPNVHALASCVKLYFRELPESLLTDEVIRILLPMRSRQADSQYIRSLKKCLSVLPTVNYNTLECLVCHLNRVYLKHSVNKMSSSNLATVIGPALTEASGIDSLLNSLGTINSVLEALIENYNLVFDRHHSVKRGDKDF